MKLQYVKTDAIGYINSIDSLCSTLSISKSDLNRALSLSNELKYSQIKLTKRDGSVRIVHNPHRLIRNIQKKINERILRPKNSPSIDWPDYVYGVIPRYNKNSPSKDYIAAAKVHIGSKSLLKLDVSNFYNNIQITLVYRIFNKFFKFSKKVSEILSKLTCHNDNLAQGALTSSYLATLIFFEIEPIVVQKILNKKIRYTRLLDDITLSSLKPNQDFTIIKALINQMLLELGLQINDNKIQEQFFVGNPLEVHGLRISFKEVRLPQNELSKIRSSVHHLELHAKEATFRVSKNYRTEYFICMGRVNKLKRLKHFEHSKLIKRVLKVRPKASHKDVIDAKNTLNYLSINYPKKSGSYKYKQQYHQLGFLLGRVEHSQIVSVSAMVEGSTRPSD